jgi:hypothetical protein
VLTTHVHVLQKSRMVGVYLRFAMRLKCLITHKEVRPVVSSPGYNTVQYRAVVVQFAAGEDCMWTLCHSGQLPLSGQFRLTACGQCATVDSCRYLASLRLHNLPRLAGDGQNVAERSRT